MLVCVRKENTILKEDNRPLAAMCFNFSWQQQIFGVFFLPHCVTGSYSMQEANAQTAGPSVMMMPFIMGGPWMQKFSGWCSENWENGNSRWRLCSASSHLLTLKKQSLCWSVRGRG